MNPGLSLARAPFTMLFDTFDHELGEIPAPLALDVAGSTLWAVGGYEASTPAVYRCVNGRWTKGGKVRARSLLCVLALDERTAIVGGAKFLGRTQDGGATFEKLGLELGKDEAVHAVAREPSGTLWAGGTGGLLARSTDDGATFERLSGTQRDTARRIVPAPWGGVYVLCEDRYLGGGVQRFLPDRKPEELSQNDLVSDLALGDGRVYGVGRDGGMASAAPGERFDFSEPFTVADFVSIRAVEGGFVALDVRSGIHTSPDGKVWESGTVPLTRPTSLVAFAGGWVIAGRDSDSGMLGYLGDPAKAPRVVASRPGIPRPRRHVRTARPDPARPKLGIEEHETIAIAEARRRFPQLSALPQTRAGGHDRIPFEDTEISLYRGDLVVDAATWTIARYGTASVIVEGNLIVAGDLSWTVRGEEYFLLVTGEISARNIEFDGEVTVFAGALEAEGVLVCWGSDFSRLMTDRARATLLLQGEGFTVEAKQIDAFVIAEEGRVRPRIDLTSERAPLVLRDGLVGLHGPAAQDVLEVFKSGGDPFRDDLD